MCLPQRAFGQDSFGFVFVFLNKLIGTKTYVWSELHLFLCCFVQVIEKCIIGESIGTSYVKCAFHFLVEDLLVSIVWKHA